MNKRSAGSSPAMRTTFILLGEVDVFIDSVGLI